MDTSLILRQLQQQPPRSCTIVRNFDHLISDLRVHQTPTSLRQRKSSKSTSLVSRSRQTITAKKKSLEGVSEELNTLASQDLSHVPARRRVRSAFIDVQQHLDHILFKMAPQGINTEEWYEVNSRGFEIFCKSWLPKADTPIKAALFFCHGYGDTCTFFFEGVARRIAASGYGVYAMDLPYFGLSEGLHGFIPSFDGLVDDVIEQYSKIKVRPEMVGLPCFLMGQSMGGAVALKFHLKQPHEWDGVILVAPMAKIAEDTVPPDAVLKIVALLSKVIPEAKLFPQKDLGELSIRDASKRKMYDYNVISYSDQMRLKTAVELLKATRDIESQLEKVSSPLLILHGAADKVTDPLVSKNLYEKASSNDKTLKLYEGSYHSIFSGEPDDRIIEVLDDIVLWLDCHCASN